MGTVALLLDENYSTYEKFVDGFESAQDDVVQKLVSSETEFLKVTEYAAGNAMGSCQSVVDMEVVSVELSKEIQSRLQNSINKVEQKYDEL